MLPNNTAANNSPQPNPQDEPISIGNPVSSSHWLFAPSTKTFDLTHSTTTTPIPSAQPPRCITLQTPTSHLRLNASQTALLIIDMQNFFLSPSLGRKPSQPLIAALTTHAIPACRKAGIRIAWVNWGLTESEVKDMPAAMQRAFSRDKLNGNTAGIYRGLGSDMGRLQGEGGGIDAGRLLMRDSWNAGLYAPLDKDFDEGRKLEKGKEDVWIHKNRMSAMWGTGTSCEEFLEREGIRTVLFAGVNTDQCVGGTLQDCFSKGYDCVLLTDGCATTSPLFAQECMEYNAAKSWGFVATCEQLAEAVASM